MHIALLALALTASPAWGRFNLFANGGVNQLDSRSGSSYGAGASQVFYAGGLVDDGMPLAYQPLEQQLPSLVLSAFYERTLADAYEGNELGGSISGTAVSTGPWASRPGSRWRPSTTPSGSTPPTS